MNENENKVIENQIDENAHTFDPGRTPKKVVLKDNHHFFKTGLGFRFISRLGFFILDLFVFIWPKIFLWNYHLKGKRNLRGKKGAIIVTNHVFQFDGLLFLSSLKLKRKIYPTTLLENFGYGFFSFFFWLAGCAPLPEDMRLFKKFYQEMRKTIKKGYNVLFFPEASMHQYEDHIRPFKEGAFKVAVTEGCEIIPIVTTFHKRKGIYKLYKKNVPLIHANILPAYTIVEQENKKATIDKALNDVHRIMSDYFNEHSDFFRK